MWMSSCYLRFREPRLCIGREIDFRHIKNLHLQSQLLKEEENTLKSHILFAVSEISIQIGFMLSLLD